MVLPIVSNNILYRLSIVSRLACLIISIHLANLISIEEMPTSNRWPLLLRIMQWVFGLLNHPLFRVLNPREPFLSLNGPRPDSTSFLSCYRCLTLRWNTFVNEYAWIRPRIGYRINHSRVWGLALHHQMLSQVFYVVLWIDAILRAFWQTYDLTSFTSLSLKLSSDRI